MHFSKKLGLLSSWAGLESLAFVSHCLANFQPIMGFFIRRYEDPDNTKADRVNTVVFTLHHIKRQAFFFLGHPVDNFS